MAAPGGEQVYATLLLSDSYLPGALVLAHSLRDAGTRHKLAVLVTLDTVSADAITQLKAVYDYILPVPRIRNDQPANLYLMNRADLHSAFTKINLWKQTQFSRIVYVDADVVAYRAPDELFKLQHNFSAAPDIGWPDIFNTGVMALTPNMGDYYAMMAMAERGISFDGADQGLLNMHFKNSVNRLSFAYNMTPSAHYQYIPAYRHFQSSINMVHFIGSNKPWFAGRNAPHGNSPFDEMVGRWWAVHDRHYRPQETNTQQSHPSAPPQIAAREEPAPTQPSPTRQQDTPTGLSVGASPPTAQGQEHNKLPQTVVKEEQAPQPTSAPQTAQHSQSHSHTRESPPPAPQQSWDAQRQPPPTDSKPEAINFPATHYEMSKDAGLFIPPARYPSPPKNMWFEVPKERPTPHTQPPRQIFPWEGHQPRPSRSFATDSVPGQTQDDASHATLDDKGKGPEQATEADAKTTSSAPSTPTIKVIPSDPWTSFPRLNAWDDVPEIGRYVDGLQNHRRVKSQGSPGGSPMALSPVSGGIGVETRRRAKPRGFKVTDFPSKDDRPSLPVTPAPIRRPSFWGDDDAGVGGGGGLGGDGASRKLPAAQGVPAQTEWDPTTQLQKLAQQQSEALLRKLGGGDGGEPFDTSREIPTRHLPYGSDPATFVPTVQPASASAAKGDIVSPRPLPAHTAKASSLVRGLSSSGEPVTSIAEPSYGGPGAAFEKGEEVVHPEPTVSLPPELRD